MKSLILRFPGESQNEYLSQKMNYENFQTEASYVTPEYGVVYPSLHL